MGSQAKAGSAVAICPDTRGGVTAGLRVAGFAPVAPAMGGGDAIVGDGVGPRKISLSGAVWPNQTRFGSLGAEAARRAFDVIARHVVPLEASGKRWLQMSRTPLKKPPALWLVKVSNPSPCASWWNATGSTGVRSAGGKVQSQMSDRSNNPRNLAWKGGQRRQACCPGRSLPVVPSSQHSSSSEALLSARRQWLSITLTKPPWLNCLKTPCPQGGNAPLNTRSSSSADHSSRPSARSNITKRCPCSCHSPVLLA